MVVEGLGSGLRCGLGDMPVVGPEGVTEFEACFTGRIIAPAYGAASTTKLDTR